MVAEGGRSGERNFGKAAALGRLAVLVAVVMQAGGQVAYGTWLRDVPSPVFVFGAILLTAGFFLLVSRKGARSWAWGPLVLLNASTALAFLSFYFALKLIEPAIAGAINIGVGPLFVMMIAFATTGARPGTTRLGICFGILAGCAILAVAAARGAGDVADGSVALAGVAASVATGVGTVLVTVSSKALLDRGWKSGAVLAHRFYLILPVSLVLALGTDPGAVEWSGQLLLAFLGIAIMGVLAPLYLLQVAIRRTDPHTVMVTMAIMPLVTFAMQGLSPAYAWTSLTAAGLGVIVAFILMDIAAARTGRRYRAAQ